MRRLAALVITALAILSPVAAAAQSPADVPLPDLDYQYKQLYDMSSQYLQRYSGQDGPPGATSPADGNLPPQVNGWQEFFAHWKEQVMSPDVMGQFAPNLHVDDHLFRAPTASFFGPPPPYDSNVASVTIPGAQCPGETVLIAGHPDSTPALNIANGSSYDDTSGITMGMAELQAMTRWWAAHHTWPARTFRVAMFDAEEIGLYGSQFYADNLIPHGPQGKIALVANMDQNGMEYPAHPAGTTKSTFGPGFWYTNINSTPIKDFSIYTKDRKPGPAPPQFAANMPAILHFRQALAEAVSQTFATLGSKYGFSVPLENPLENGATIEAYRQSDIATYSPVQDDTLGRTDQVPFIQQGIPGYGIVGAYDSNPQDNPLGFPVTPLTPLGASGLPQIAGYDTPRDNMTHLNIMASGTTGGGTGANESLELRRALELPMDWTLNLISRPEYVGGVAAPTGPVAYFEALPTQPKVGDAVSFNGAETAANGGTGLTYSWDFGDGTRATGQVVKHSYTAAGWYDAKLVVTDGQGRRSGYRQAVPVGAPKTAAPATDGCGVLSATELTAVTSPVVGPTPNTSRGPAPLARLVTLLLAVVGLAGVAHWQRRRPGRQS